MLIFHHIILKQMMMISKLFTFKYFYIFEKTLTGLDGFSSAQQQEPVKIHLEWSNGAETLGNSLYCRVQQLGKVWSQSEHSKYSTEPKTLFSFTKKNNNFRQNPDWTQKQGPANHEHVSHLMGPEMLKILGTSYAPAFFIIGRRVFILGQVNL